MDTSLKCVFWIGAVLLFHTFIGYPLLINFLGKRLGWARCAAPNPGHPPPKVSVVLVVRNEAHRLRDRVLNLLSSHHPADSLEIIVVSDGSDDQPSARLEGLPVQLIESPRHRGKPACLNDGVAAAAGELIVFADARQSFQPETIPALVSAFSDPLVGAVSGELIIRDSDNGLATGVNAYWRMEKAIRLGESGVDSSIGCTGAVYAIRKEAFEPLPHDTILDDVVCPMRIALKGLRVRFEPDAPAFDPQPLDPDTEKRRKRRTLAGNFQMLFRHPSWLLPWKNRLFLQLLSHKYLRLAAPLLLLLTLVSSILLAWRGSTFFTVASAAQVAFYLLAAIGMAAPGARSRLLSLPAAFTFLNLMTILGFIDFLRKRHQIGW